MTENNEYSLLYDAIRSRHSIRSFTKRSLDRDLLNKLNVYAHALGKASGKIRIVIVSNAPEGIFKGLVGSYGVIRNAGAYAVFIGNSQDTRTAWDIGYYGEKFILYSVAQGLGTCWISGSFHSNMVLKDVPVREGERVYVVTPLGYAAENEASSHRLIKAIVGSARKKTAEQISNLTEAGNETWMRAAAEALRMAPSTRNMQPWYAEFKSREICLHAKANTDKGLGLDMGIAMLHLELGVLSCGKTGRWLYPNNGTTDGFRFEIP